MLEELVLDRDTVNLVLDLNLQLGVFSASAANHL